MELRFLTIQDAESYLSLQQEGVQKYPIVFAFSTAEMQAKQIEQISEQLAKNETQDDFVLGAFSESTLCGVVNFRREGLAKMRHKGLIWGVFVHPAFQGQGLAKKLLSRALDEIKRLEGMEQVSLMVNVENEPARKLYHSLGFVSYGLEKNALKVEGKYYDEELMVCFLKEWTGYDN